MIRRYDRFYDRILYLKESWPTAEMMDGYFSVILLSFLVLLILRRCVIVNGIIRLGILSGSKACDVA